MIGRTARNIAPDEAGDYIRGYSIANDYGLHDFRDTDSGSMLRVKGADTLCPVGPGLVEGWDFHGKQIRTLVNGSVRQDGNTNEMKWDMHYLVADIARTITLQPGDILLSGTPAISRTVYPGDVVEVEVKGSARCATTSSKGQRLSAAMWARNPPSPKRFCPPPKAAIGSSAASASRNPPECIKKARNGALVTQETPSSPHREPVNPRLPQTSPSATLNSCDMAGSGYSLSLSS